MRVLFTCCGAKGGSPNLSAPELRLLLPSPRHFSGPYNLTMRLHWTASEDWSLGCIPTDWRGWDLNWRPCVGHPLCSAQINSSKSWTRVSAHPKLRSSSWMSYLLCPSRVAKTYD